MHLSRARGGWAAASRLPPRARPGTRLATAPLLGNRSPSGAPPRPFWEVGSRPGGPPRRSQSMSLGSKEAERRGLPLGIAPATHGGGGALTCEPREPWGAANPLHRPGRFRTRALFAAKFRAADWGRPTWLTARALSSERASLSFPEETGGTCKLCHFRCRGSAREPETQRECAPGGLASRTGRERPLAVDLRISDTRGKMSTFTFACIPLVSLIHRSVCISKKRCLVAKNLVFGILVLTIWQVTQLLRASIILNSKKSIN